MGVYITWSGVCRGGPVVTIDFSYLGEEWPLTQAKIEAARKEAAIAIARKIGLHQRDVTPVILFAMPIGKEEG